MNIQKDIQNLLNEKGWTQDQLAEAAGISQPTISNLVTGAKKGCGSKIFEKLAPLLYPKLFESEEDTTKQNEAA